MDTLDTTFFKICFVQISCAAGSAAVELFICLKVIKPFSSRVQLHLLIFHDFFQIEFFPAVALAWSFLTQIVCYCAIGTVIEICVSYIFSELCGKLNFSLLFRIRGFDLFFSFQNGQIYDGIIRCDWFLLPQFDKFLYKFLMFNAQETKALTIGGIAPLNMISCVSVSYKFK